MLNEWVAGHICDAALVVLVSRHQDVSVQSPSLAPAGKINSIWWLQKFTQNIKTILKLFSVVFLNWCVSKRYTLSSSHLQSPRFTCTHIQIILQTQHKLIKMNQSIIGAFSCPGNNIKLFRCVLGITLNWSVLLYRTWQLKPRPQVHFQAVRWKTSCRKGYGQFVKLTWLIHLRLYYILKYKMRHSDGVTKPDYYHLVVATNSNQILVLKPVLNQPVVFSIFNSVSNGEDSMIQLVCAHWLIVNSYKKKKEITIRCDGNIPNILETINNKEK